jgi:pSer/pThr/pTyr-binding forkhead associated (FHA) protein
MRRVVPLDRPNLRLGRAADNDIVLEDPDQRVSRRHATMEGNPDGIVTICDVGSANGTFVNGQRITGKVPLHNRDQIEIGAHQLELRADEYARLPWKIETGSDELDSLQNQPRLIGSDMGSMKSSLETLELLHEVGITLARTETVNQVMEQAIKLLLKIKGVQRTTLWLWREKEGSFEETPLMTGPGRDWLSGGVFDPQNLARGGRAVRAAKGFGQL